MPSFCSSMKLCLLAVLAGTASASPVIAHANGRLPTMHLAPAVDSRVDIYDPMTLVPSKVVALHYQQTGQGTTAASLSYSLKSPSVSLENSVYVQNVICSAFSLSVEFDQDQDEYLSVVKAWPQDGLTMITFHDGCNSSNDRGAYQTRACNFDNVTRIFACESTSKEWKEVASGPTIDYSEAVPRHSSEL